MSQNIQQVYLANPITSNASTDLMYFGQSPYGAGNDAAMTYANFAAQFGAPYTPAALTSTNDTNVTITLGGTPATALLQAASITMGWSGQLGVTRGGTGLASTTANQLLYSSANNTIAGLATANSSVLVTSAGGAPNLSTTLPNGLALGTPASGLLTSCTGRGALRTFTYLTSGSGTYTVPAGCTALLVEMVGGGGSGAGAVGSGTQYNIGGGGSAGAYVRSFISSPSASYSYAVGAGGLGSSGNVAGNNGGNTTFSTYTAGGGKGGISPVPVNYAASNIVGVPGNGNGTGGDLNITGGTATIGFGFSSTQATSGGGGPSIYGAGAAGVGSGFNGNNGSGYGSGGSGAQSATVTSYTGGNGSSGLIIIWEFY